MRDTAHQSVAIVGLGAVLPDAPDVPTFWSNLLNGHYSITETPADRWDAARYFDPDPKAPDATYSKIGGWVRESPWDPVAWKLPIPPTVGAAMDRSQRWAIAAAREALADYGWPGRPLDGERTAVILGNAMGGDRHYLTALRLFFPEYARELALAPSFAALPEPLRQAVAAELKAGMGERIPAITEDTMPGELSNIIAGRIANLFNFHGPNYVVDAACASAMAALGSAIEGLEEGDFDVVVSGGIDANMSAPTFIKFCKIGALSATGTRPFAEGADGFVMGEGAAVFVLKRLADAQRDGDRVYAVLRGVGGASDGRGKGITAPNPYGQRLAIERAWANAGLSPATVSLIEGHGTSTKVGDVAEVESLDAVFGKEGLAAGSVPLGSVKSNIGHLKGAAGAAGLLKAALALHHKVIPPSLHCAKTNPNIDFAKTPFFVSTALAEWRQPPCGIRRAGVSAFGFGGTNFHAVLEEHAPQTGEKKERRATPAAVAAAGAPAAPKAPLRGVLVLGASSPAELASRLGTIRDAAAAGRVPPFAAPRAADLRAPHRLALDYGDGAELVAKADKALAAFSSGHAGMWRALRAQGLFVGQGPAPELAFLYTGQGSQYLGMLGGLRAVEPIVAATFAEADRVMEPLLGRPLSSYLFPTTDDPALLAKAEEELRQTAITQPAVLAADVALTRLFAAYGIRPDRAMGHSLGEYAALVAAECLSFAEALEAVSARGREMGRLSVADNGRMIAVMAPLAEIEETLAAIDGYVVVANINSAAQAVVGGATAAVDEAERRFKRAGREVRPLNVSHAFHTTIVAPASEPLRRMLERLALKPPRIPVVGNATGELYPMGGAEVLPAMIDLLARQIASPVQFVKGLETLYAQGTRAFVEVGPKRALQGFAEDVLGRHDRVTALASNHPKTGDVASFNHALCGLYALGLGTGIEERPAAVAETATVAVPRRMPETPEVVVTGAAVGLPGTAKVFDDGNLRRILSGEQGIETVPLKLRREMVDKRITRLVKSDQGGGPRFEAIESPAEVIKLAARAGEMDLTAQFGLPADWVAAFDHTTQLAIGAGIDALRDAGIPLVLRYKTTTTGGRLPHRWGLPEAMRDDTGVIFASAFPGLDSLVGQVEHYHRVRALEGRLAELASLRERLNGNGSGSGAPESPAITEIDRRIRDLRAQLAADPFRFDRRFLFQVLAMGHAQLAEAIGARGPNTQINSACASTTQAFALAGDWIRAGRCRRVVIVAADDIASDKLFGWFGAGFLASGAAATDELVEDAALPFDRRRHGLIVGMGAAGFVLESAEAARERGLAPICRVLGEVTANSAYHGSRLDVDHISRVMERLVSEVESRHGLDRHSMAPELLFMSHETYTPARGGSAQAEVEALRRVFGSSADRIVVANTKGYTGHPMAVGIEDAVAVKCLETGLVPPVANVKERDPELGMILNLSKGGAYPVRWALRLGAGFGSQISMTLLAWVPPPDGQRRAPEELGYAYRVADRAAFDAWLAAAAGAPQAELEVVHRTLRVVDRGAAAPSPQPREELRATPATPAITAPAPTTASPAPRISLDRTDPSDPSDRSDTVAETVLALIAEKTGYPVEMLDPDLDLEADLGIDTVKQAEMFAAIRERYAIPRDENLRLRDFPTLAKTVQFVYDRRPDLKAPATERREEPHPEPVAAAPEPTIPRRVPIPVCRPALGMCRPTGATLAAGRRVVVVCDAGGVGEALSARLGALGVEVLTVRDAPPAAELSQRLASWSAAGAVHGLYWLPALDAPGDLARFSEPVRVRVKLFFTALGALYAPLGEPGSFVIAATCLGGRHGYDAAGALEPLGGAVTGLAKALHRERPEAVVKVVDFAASLAPATVADALIEETLFDPGAVEIGRDAADRRLAIGLAEEPLGQGPGLTLGKDTVYLVTGAAGSIVSAILCDLAATGGTYHLLDLAPEPDPNDPDVARLTSDREGLQRDLYERLKARGERATPALVEKELARLERAQAALVAITAIRAAGGEAVYHQLDLRDAAQVSRVVDEVRRRHGRVDVLLHAAGLEISRLLADKRSEEFDLVFDVKALGWLNLLAALGDLPLGAAVVFSSVAGRFGNGGQADYSAANDFLCKAVSHLRRSRPETLGIALDWTAWGGIGMATRGSIPQAMAAAGIDRLAPAIGIAWVRNELAAGTRGEVVVAGRLGAMLAEPGDGFDPAKAAPAGVLAGRAAAWGLHRGLTVETLLVPAEQPFLDHHRIDGTAVLPGVMGIEAFAEAARMAFPDLAVAAVEDVAFHAPFKLYRDEPRSISVEARFTPDGDGVAAHCRLLGRRRLAGQEDEQETVHFTGRVRLAREAAAAPTLAVPKANGHTVGHDAIYRVYFHGPAFQVMESGWRHGDGMAGQLAAPLPADHRPADQPMVMEPRLIELCFQTAGLGELVSTGRLGLPFAVDAVRTLAHPAAGARLVAVTRTDDGRGVDADVIDDRGTVCLEVRGYRTTELPQTLDGAALAPLRAALEAGW